jgi:hypothetical protein
MFCKKMLRASAHYATMGHLPSVIAVLGFLKSNVWCIAHAQSLYLFEERMNWVRLSFDLYSRRHEHHILYQHMQCYLTIHAWM